MKHYQQLTIEEREKIQSGLWGRKSLRNIARDLGRNPSTISRELQRNIRGERIRYVPRLANERARERIQSRGKRERLKHPSIRKYARNKLRKGYSPEQIAGRLRIERPDHIISHEAIYQYIYAQYRRGGYGICTGADLRRFLRRRHKVRHPKKTFYAVEKGALRNRISIDERPPEVDDRKVAGHWEGDSMVSRQSRAGLNTLVERNSGLVFISKLSRSSDATETARVVIRRLQRIPRNLRRTLTLDNGFENARHEEIVYSTGTRIYFAHPYHSWERGTNENTNGLIRWYLPKGTDFATVSKERIKEIEHCLNTRPRKRLRWRTPLEVFNQSVALKC